MFIFLSFLFTACSMLPTVETYENLVDYLEITVTVAPSVTPVIATPTLPPIPTVTPTPILLSFSEDVYTHPQGLFDFPPPRGWVVTKEQEGAVEFNNTDTEISLQVFVTNTDLTLDKESFQRLIEAQEINIFGAYPGYQEITKKYDPLDNYAIVEKQLIVNEETRQVVSYYRQSSKAVLTLNVWSNSTLSTQFITEFESFFSKISLFPDKISTQPPYRWTYEFVTANGLYTGQVPIQWMREQASNDTTQIDRFTSPDRKAVIQLILYDDGELVSKKIAGAIVVTMLHQEYDPDLTIIEDKILPEGGELLTWKTTQSGINGATHFEMNGTKLKIMTWSYLTAEKTIYNELVQKIVESIHAVE